MSKEYNALSLDREKLLDSIKSYLDLYFNKCLIGKLQNKVGTRKRVDIEADCKSFYMDFHYNTDGTTTIEDFGGSNVEIKKNLAHFIKSNCSISNEKRDTWFVVKNIEKQDFEAILDLLKDSEYYKKGHTFSPEDKGSSILYRLKGKYNEDLVITRFNTGTVQIQGKPLLLFNEAMSMLGELLELDEIPTCYNKLYKIEIDKDAVREKCKLYMQNSYHKINGKLKKCIHQAVYYELIDGEMFDYSAIPLTAFRSLEGHIKYVLKEFEFITTRHKPIGSFYDKDGSKYILKTEVKEKINNDNKCNNLEKDNDKYHYIRNSLSHWDDLMLENDEDTTEMIENIDVARTYVRDTLSIIDAYYGL